MQNFVLVCYLFCASCFFGQQTTLWFKADPQAFSQEEWHLLSKKYSLSEPVKALSASRNPELLKVYELSGLCTVDEFKIATKTFGSLISSIERGPEYRSLYNPNDLNAQPGVSDYALMLINAPQAWDITQGDDSVVIAISDQNFDVTHPDLEGKYVHYDASNMLTTTHGTAVAITAAGKTDNGFGLSAIGYNTSLALYKMNFNDVLAASYAGADVINISWTSGCFYSQLEQDVMDEVAQNGSFVVASAGNGNTCGLPDAFVYPASYNHVFSVTSVGPSDNHEQWIGDPNSTHNHNDSVDLAAPGYDVAVSPASNWFLNMSGTSFAAAYVSGTVALMLAENKCLSNVDIETILKNTAVNIDGLNPSYAGKIGAGRLNAFQAVTAASSVWNPISVLANSSDSCGINDAWAQLSISGAQAPFTVQWSNGCNSLLNSGLSSNNYMVHVEGTHGCRIDTIISVVDVPLPTYSFSTTNPSCYLTNNGSIQLDQLLPIETFVTWSNGQNGSVVNNLSAGTILASLHYGVACVVNDTFTIQEPDPILITANINNESAPGNGSIQVTVQGGTGNYQFLWNNGSTNQDLLSVAAGTYDLTVTDGNGCSSQAFYQIINEMGAGITLDKESNIGIFPNPNNGVFSINTPTDEAFQVKIFDAQGRLIEEFLVYDNSNLELKLSPAKYHCRMVGTTSHKTYDVPMIVF